MFSLPQNLFLSSACTIFVHKDINFCDMKIQIINGPNINLLGKREPGIYGSQSFDDYLQILKQRYPNVEIAYYQSNCEGNYSECWSLHPYIDCLARCHTCHHSACGGGAYQQCPCT